MDAALFIAHNVNTKRAAIEGSFDFPDGSRVIWALSRSEFGAMSFNNRPEWDVAHNRMQFLREFGLSIENVVAPHQQHTTKVLSITGSDASKGARELESAPGIADALLTQEPNLILMTTHADCMPIWMCSPGSGWIGMAHAGWRGLHSGMISKFIETVPEKAREDLVLAVGPCISTKNYEIGEDLAEQFLKNRNIKDAVHIEEEHYYLDLAKGAKLEGMNAGVEVVTETALCTFENKRFLSSYRRDGENFNPMAAFITRVRN